MKKTKRFLAVLLTLAMVLAVAAPALATSVSHGNLTSASVENGGTISIAKTLVNEEGKEYTLPNNVTATLEVLNDGQPISVPSGVTASDVVIGGNDHKITATISGTDATRSGAFSITLPTYSKVGEYDYALKELSTGVAGVVDNTSYYCLKVFVRNDETTGGYNCEATLRLYSNYDETTKTLSDEGEKEAAIENVYQANKLVVKNNVSGDLADRSQLFPFDIVFTLEDGKTFPDELITWIGRSAETGEAGDSHSVTFETVDGKTVAKITVYLKDNESVTFENLPVGTTYTVEERSSTWNGTNMTNTPSDVTYTVTYTSNGENVTMADGVKIEGTIGSSSNDYVAGVENVHEGTVDTGVILDTAPYILIIGVVVVGIVLLVMRKHRDEE